MPASARARAGGLWCGLRARVRARVRVGLYPESAAAAAAAHRSECAGCCLLLLAGRRQTGGVRSGPAQGPKCAAHWAERLLPPGLAAAGRSVMPFAGA